VEAVEVKIFEEGCALSRHARSNGKGLIEAINQELLSLTVAIASIQLEASVAWDQATMALLSMIKHYFL
jgi:hypothetical protein